MQMTMYPTKPENEKKTKIKANISLDTKDFTLTGFKLYENDQKELKLMIPSEIVKDANGEPKKNENEQIINKHPVSINDRLTNRQKIFNDLQTEIVNMYNEVKANPKVLEGQNFVQKEVNMPEVEQGELNVKKVFLANPQKNTNPDYQLKANATLLTGAFQINNVPLIYDVKKNDYSIILPKQEYKNESGETVSRGYAVPKNAEVFAKVKNMIVNTVESKIKENRQEYLKQKQAENLAQAQKQGVAQTTQKPTAPVMK